MFTLQLELYQHVYPCFGIRLFPVPLKFCFIKPWGSKSPNGISFPEYWWRHYVTLPVHDWSNVTKSLSTSCRFLPRLVVRLSGVFLPPATPTCGIYKGKWVFKQLPLVSWCSMASWRIHIYHEHLKRVRLQRAKFPVMLKKFGYNELNSMNECNVLYSLTARCIRTF